MIEYLQNIVTSFVDEIKDELDLPVRQKALAIFDCFRGQITEDFLYTLKSNILVYVTIPPNWTDKLQPMDLSVNKSAKDFLKAQFQNWYAEQFVTYIDKHSDKVEAVKIDLSLTTMKPLGAKWLVKLYDHVCTNPTIIRNGFSGSC